MNEANLPPMGTGRLTEIVQKNLTPAMGRAAMAMADAYEALDIEVITTLQNAAEDFLAALPIIDGYEDEIRQMAIELVADMCSRFEAYPHQNLRLRFAYQNEADLVDQLLSIQASRLVVVPVEDSVSLHADVLGLEGEEP